MFEDRTIMNVSHTITAETILALFLLLQYEQSVMMLANETETIQLRFSEAEEIKELM